MPPNLREKGKHLKLFHAAQRQTSRYYQFLTLQYIKSSKRSHPEMLQLFLVNYHVTPDTIQNRPPPHIQITEDSN